MHISNAGRCINTEHGINLMKLYLSINERSEDFK